MSQDEGPVSLLLQGALLLLSVWTFLYKLPLSFEKEDTAHVLVATAGFCAFRSLWPIVFTKPVFDLIDPPYEDEETRVMSRKKCANHMNKLFLHGSLQIWGLWVLSEQEWFHGWTTTEGIWWEGWTKDATEPCSFRTYYLTQLAFFLGSIIMQYFEPRSHDHVAMLAHHYASATLIFMSHIFNSHRIGLLVLVSREITDVFIHLARALGLLKWRKTGEAVLITMLIFWFFSRNLYHPLIICYSAFYSPVAQYHTMWVIFNVLLALLAPLDLYYILLGLQAIVRRIQNPNLANIDPDAPANTKKKAN